MPIIGSFSYGSASAIQYSTVEELLSQLPDNTQNIIVAQDIRDAVYTLWERTALTASSTASAFFQNSNPTIISVGGIPSGSSFNVPVDMQTIWNQLLYPYIPQTNSLSISGQSTREYGNPNGLSSGSITLNWGVIRNSNSIISINVDSQSFTATGNTQNGTKLSTGTHSWNTSLPSQINTFTMSSSDGTTNISTPVNLTWMNKIYWGRINLSSIGNPNLSINPNLSSQVATLCTDNAIINLTGAGVGSGSQLSTSKNATYNGIDANGWYLIFAWPSSVSGAFIPSFTVNGMPNNSFTRVRTLSPFVNQYGFTTNYEVWISNILQNSALNIVIS
jgi:hypothetical protein